jgi:glycosyltransferase involved in cell wall biosynthesis
MCVDVSFRDLESIKNPFGLVRTDLASLAERFTEGLVSVVMPCFNGEDYLHEAIDSVLAQSYKPIELIVVDDGSTDQSRAILESYGDQISRIYQSRQGAAKARNEALTLAKGEFIQFLDADDVLYCNAISDRIKAMESDVDAVFSGYERIDRAGGHLDSVTFENNRCWSDDEVLRVLMDRPGALITISPLHRRKKLYLLGGFDEALPRHQDSNLHLRLMANGHRFKYHPAIIGGVRIHESPTRISSNFRWWENDPAYLLKVVVNYHSIINECCPRLLSGYFKTKLSEMLDNVAPAVGASVSMSWGLRYLRESRFLLSSPERMGRRVSGADVCFFIVRLSYIWLRLHGGRLRRLCSVANRSS